MGIVEDIRNEWLATKQPHVPYKTHVEIEREYNRNLMLAARIEDKLGRKLSDREIFDLTM